MSDILRKNTDIETGGATVDQDKNFDLKWNGKRFNVKEYLAARGRTTQESRSVSRCAARVTMVPSSDQQREGATGPRNGLPQAQQKAQKSGK